MRSSPARRTTARQSSCTSTSTRVPSWEPKSNLTPDSTDKTGCGTKADCMKIRCPWPKDDRYIEYHDTEWGVPVHDDRTLFEFVVLEGAQAGLSWSTILNKRDHYRKVFDKFDARKIAKYQQTKVDALLGDAGIVRNRMKIAVAIGNAKAFLAVQKEFGTFD